MKYLTKEQIINFKIRNQRLCMIKIDFLCFDIPQIIERLAVIFCLDIPLYKMFIAANTCASPSPGLCRNNQIATPAKNK